METFYGVLLLMVFQLHFSLPTSILQPRRRGEGGGGTGFGEGGAVGGSFGGAGGGALWGGAWGDNDDWGDFDNEEGGLCLPSNVSPTEDFSADFNGQVACGVQEVKPFLAEEGNITGGRPATPHSWPWQVAVSINGEVSCGGSLITSMAVLTAAHCVVSQVEGLIEPEFVKIVSGLHRRGDVGNPHQGGPVVSDVEKIVPHIGFVESGFTHHDIAVIVLSHPLTFTRAIHPICRPDLNEVPQDGAECMITGWGASAEEASGDEVEALLQAEIEVVGDHQCQQIFLDSGLGHLIDPSSNICAVGKGSDTCQSNSGGPLQCRREDGSWYLAGVTSWGEGCRGDLPGIYSQVEHYARWIDNAMHYS